MSGRWCPTLTRQAASLCSLSQCEEDFWPCLRPACLGGIPTAGSIAREHSTCALPTVPGPALAKCGWRR